MRRVVIHAPGGHDRLKLEIAPDPAPGRGEVRVRTEAIGVNYADVVVRMGLYQSAKKYVGWPITPGFEVSGVIDAVGDGVAEGRVGERVFAVTRFFGYATHVVVPEHQALPVPARFSMEQAAAFPAVFLTAQFALFELANLRVRPGRESSVLVHSAAGGVGSALVQLGKLAGAKVVAVVGGAHKVGEAKRLGADVVIDKSTEDLWREARRAAPEGYDVVLDANGAETLAQSYTHLGSPGRLVIYGFATMMSRGRDRPSWPKLVSGWLRTPRYNPLTLTTDNKSVLALNLSYLFDRREIFDDLLATLLAWVSDGKLEPPTVTTFPLDDVARAHEALESGRTIGKLVLVP